MSSTGANNCEMVISSVLSGPTVGSNPAHAVESTAPLPIGFGAPHRADRDVKLVNLDKLPLTPSRSTDAQPSHAGTAKIKV
jgi:hypothetical protein